MFHVIGVVNLIRADVTLGGHPLVDAEPDEGCEHKRRAVEHKQFTGFLFIDGCCPCFVPQTQRKAAFGGGQQLGARKHPAEAEPQRPAVQNRRRPLDERQADRRAEPVQIAVISQQFVGLQQAGEICIFNYIQPTGGRDDFPNTKHKQRPGQGGRPSGSRPTGNECRQHDPQPHDERPGPLGQQKAE